ncbi:hypothetical protein FOZ63_004650 [Perkinsus olseni]|uniref:Uncharacterized protein n=1 Tax=Perkinsus olseni TaxID=32597 RepID=A0A7J6SPT4_PEROL|nr:hypothetical protein FOZ63_004650 [Perkinsus olseni]
MDPRSTSPPEATVKGVARREKCWKARDDFFQCLTDNNEATVAVPRLVFIMLHGLWAVSDSGLNISRSNGKSANSEVHLSERF